MERKESQEKRKRVSFAPEASINFYANEVQQNTKSTSSNEDLSILNENEESLSLTCAAIPTSDDGYNFYSKIEEEKENKNFEEKFNEEGNFMEIKSSFEKIGENNDELNKSIEKIVDDAIRYNIPLNEINIFGESIEKIIEKEKMIEKEDQEDLKMNTKDFSFLNNNFMTETINMREIIDTQDLRKFIPENKNEKINFNDLLVSHGIRFLDKMIYNRGRRSTISKSKNVVTPNLKNYYKFFKINQINFYENFIFDLERLNEEQEKTNENLENEFKIKGSLLEDEDKDKHLKMLKSVCRSTAKVKWYEIRKKYALEFYEKIINEKNFLSEKLNRFKRENDNYLSKINSIKEKIEKMEFENNNLQKKIEKYSKTDILEVTNLQNTIKEQNMVHERIKKNLEGLEENMTMKRNKYLSLESQVCILRKEVEEISTRIKSMNITEQQMLEVRDSFKIFSKIFNIQIIKLNSYFFQFEIGFFEFYFYFSTEKENIFLKEINIHLKKNEKSYKSNTIPLIYQFFTEKTKKNLQNFNSFNEILNLKNKNKNTNWIEEIRNSFLFSYKIKNICKEILQIESHFEINSKITDNKLFIDVEVINLKKVKKYTIRFEVLGFDLITFSVLDTENFHIDIFPTNFYFYTVT
ncbi:putative Spc7 kinetochore protein, partial [Hamiltosporidium magnivora]